MLKKILFVLILIVSIFFIIPKANAGECGCPGNKVCTQCGGGECQGSCKDPDPTSSPNSNNDACVSNGVNYCGGGGSNPSPTKSAGEQLTDIDKQFDTLCSNSSTCDGECEKRNKCKKNNNECPSSCSDGCDYPGHCKWNSNNNGGSNNGGGNTAPTQSATANTCTIQGFKPVSYANATVTAVEANISSTDNPFYLQVPKGTYTVKIDANNTSIFSTMCADATNCHSVTDPSKLVGTSRAQVTCNGGYTDLWWQVVSYPPASAAPPTCSSDGWKATLSWTESTTAPSAISHYIVRAGFTDMPELTGNQPWMIDDGSDIATMIPKATQHVLDVFPYRTYKPYGIQTILNSTYKLPDTTDATWLDSFVCNPQTTITTKCTGATCTLDNFVNQFATLRGYTSPIATVPTTLQDVNNDNIIDMKDFESLRAAQFDNATASPTQNPTAITTPKSALPQFNNYNFEQGKTGWTEVTSSNYGIIFSKNDANFPRVVRETMLDGDYIAWNLGDINTTSELYQTITLPSDYHDLNLRYLYYIASEENNCGEDWGNLRINDLDVKQYQLCNSEETNKFKWEVIDINRYKGQTVKVSFWGKGDRNNNSNWFVDLVELCSSDADAPSGTRRCNDPPVIQ